MKDCYKNPAKSISGRARRHFAILILAALCSLQGCGSGTDSPPLTNDEINAELEKILGEAVSGNENIPGAVIQLDAPDRGLSTTIAAGYADLDDSSPMIPNSRFRLASVTKMMTATLILRLAEEELVSLDQKAEFYLNQSGIDFDQLHVLKGHIYGHDVTVRHLLGHRSGLADYVFDGPVDGNGFSPFLSYVMSHPDKQWQPLELIEWTIENLEPSFPPGQGFHYSDGNYVLLGMIIEKVTDNSLANAYRSYIFDPLEMNDTYLEFHEDALPGDPPSHPYLDTLNLAPINTSFDWAGGGLVSTTGDLTKFIRAFADDQIFENSTSRTDMLQFNNIGFGYGYGLGVYKAPYREGTVWGHEGFYGVIMLYWPDKNTTIVGTFNQSAQNLESKERKLMRLFL